MRTHTLTISLLASVLQLAACVADAPTADTEAVATDELAAAAAAIPATPNLQVEFLGCSGIAADYLVTFPSAGATRYDADYRRGSGAWASLSDGAAAAARFATSDHITTVTFRARACSAAGCSSFDLTSPFRPRQCTGSTPNL